MSEIMHTHHACEWKEVTAESSVLMVTHQCAHCGVTRRQLRTGKSSIRKIDLVGQQADSPVSEPAVS